MPKRSPPPIGHLRYRPPAGYGLDLEVMSISDLRSRGSEAHFRRPQRTEFVLAFGVTAGGCAHMVDFFAHACRPGTWIVLKPGQVQRFDFSRKWEGWVVVFRPEFVLPAERATGVAELSMAGLVENLPNRLDLPEREHAAAIAAVAQMAADARMPASGADRAALLRHQLYALLLRLSLSQPAGPSSSASALSAQRFRRFHRAVEEAFRTTHRVQAYARRLGCSAKSLTRATREAAGASAKEFLSQRIALEAKRLLAYTTRPVGAVAEELGFDEPTNFVKFFRRAAGCSPGDFRRRNSGALAG